MVRRGDDGDDRTSIGDVVLWLALAALMAVVILGVATLIRLQPTLAAHVKSGTQIAIPMQHVQVVGTVAPRASH
jgi:hypothetical protein